ncbi:hypothetical protein D0T50_08425 [Bacteroides sp. 214]|uniref:hypothetical protein n=1 Tax=Bacteroides sp. 214 TaxID=2302935 RepID=UPI0013D334D1|nr:hypothetical protein [Bacteroides sp. 214]NDW12917.1 hypothetical protein [Bacteroides sp. 214]
MRSNYQPPQLEIIEMQNEGSIMTGSGLSQMEGQDFINNISSSTDTNIHQEVSHMQDMEDVLNELFTVQK